MSKQKTVHKKEKKGKYTVKCWELLKCRDSSCPAYEEKILPCWFIPNTHCGEKKQKSFIYKIQQCMNCKVFLENFQIKDKNDAYKYIIKEIKYYTKKLEKNKEKLQKTVQDKNTEIEEIIALSKVKEKMTIESLGEAEKLSEGLVETLEQTEEKHVALEEAVELLKIKEKMLISSIKESDDLASTLQETLLDLQQTTVSKNYLDTILKSISDSLIVTSNEGKISKVNRALLDLLYYDERELINKPFQFIFSSECNKDNKLLNLFEESPIKNYETIWKTKNNAEIPVIISISEMMDENHTSVGKTIVGKDITNRKNAEEELKSFADKLKQSNQELQNFASIASHDLQEPLRKVIAFGDRLKSKYSSQLGEIGNDYLDRMRSATTRMQTLINDLLSYSRVTSKGKPFSESNLKQIVQEVISDLDIRIKQTEGKINVKNLVTIDADPLQMRQLFQNFISNALKFHKKGLPPVVDVEGQYVKYLEGKSVISNEESDFIQLTFQDNGIGFDEKYLDRIFGIFQRLHNRNEYEGTGIGLAICRRIVERHGGSITGHSTPGQGAQFIIVLPVKHEIKNKETAEAEKEEVYQ
ncbi:MAG: ATP-binding protein [Chitinispirillia bacterium]|jgi:PAS domain S-box-containing protein